MIILHLNINGPYTEGMGYQENMLARYHARMGHEVYMVAPPYCYVNGKLTPCKSGHSIVEEGVHLVRLPYKYIINEYVSNKLRLVKKLYNEIDKINPDFIMLHDTSTLSVFDVKKYVKKHNNVFLIADNHADFSNSARNWVSKQILHKIIYKYTTKIIEPYIKTYYGVLPARVDFIINMYKVPPEKCKLLLMGVDDDLAQKANTEESCRSIRKKYNITSQDFLIITGGKIDSAKRQVLLLMKAIHMIQDENVKLIIFGSVEDEIKEEFMELVDGNKIQFIGWLSSAETYPIISSANLAVYPGRHSTLWEQTAGQGIPMVVRSWPGTHHVNVCGNVEFLYEDTIEEIKEKIYHIVQNKKDYIKLCSAAQKAMTAFSYKAIAEQCLKGE